jgi:hypothetical protein
MPDREQFENLVRLLTDAGFPPRSYSGREMYGKKCLGIVLESSSGLWPLAIELGKHEDDLPYTFTQREPKTDSLGLDVIAYWPGVEWIDLEEADEDEEEEE